ncbi:GTPase HflX [Mycoplasmatota bacterium WC30]
MENAILVGLDQNINDNFDNSMLELANLATACGVNVLDTLIQKRDKPTSNFYIGKGKINELLEAITTLDADLVIFNDELSPSHIRNIEAVINTKVIDRTVLILDIFARRAKTREAMLQVELAQAKYFMPRVIGLYKYLSRQKSGTGSKGPGEQQLELDRRILRNKISKLKRDLNELVKVRRIQREKRKKNEVFTVALTGYTNSGKSTLMNSIIDVATAHKEGYAFQKNMLFATLETKTKQIHLDNNHNFLITDTVGFIDKLPHHLIEAFKSTLEEISEASLILHVIDISNSDYENQIHTVEEVLKDIGIQGIPIIYVFNKIDQIETLPHITKEHSITVSALNNTNTDKLLKLIDKELYKTIKNVEMLIPFSRSDIYSNLKENSNVLETEYLNEGIKVQVELDEYHYNKYKNFVK